MKFFSGSSNPKLAKEVSDILKLPISKSEVVRFENSETRVRVEENVENELCVVLQTTSNSTDTHIMELLFFCDALKRSSAKKVVGVIPYFGYARQNRQHRSGETVSVNVVIKFIEAIGFDEVITIDLHDEATEGVFSIPFKNISVLPLLAEEIRKSVDPKKSVVVSPDQGGVERAQKFADSFFGKNGSPIVVIEKERDLEKIHQSRAMDIFGDVKDKTVIIVDDIVTSGGTLVHAADLCFQEGASSVIAGIVHHDFSDKAPKIIEDSKIEKFFTTNTIKLHENQKFPKLAEISVAALIAKELEKI